MNDQIIVDAFLFVPVHARDVVMTISDADESADSGEYTHLFQAGKNLTGCLTLQRIVGRHVEVFGSGFELARPCAWIRIGMCGLKVVPRWVC